MYRIKAGPVPKSPSGLTLLFALMMLGSTVELAHGLDIGRSIFVDAGEGIRIYCTEKGDGRSILFVPGWTMPGAVWEQQIKHFSREYRVVAIDPRAQGRSSQTTIGLCPEIRAKDIQSVVEQLNLAPVVLVGWSLGATEAIAYVDLFGTKKVAGLILVDGLAGIDLPAGMKPEELQAFKELRTNRHSFTERFVRGMFKSSVSNTYVEHLVSDSMKTPTESAIRLSLASMGADYRPALPKIDVPTLILVAARPDLTPFKNMQSKIPRSRLEVFNNSGHALFVDEAPRFNELLDGFMTRLEQ